MTPLGSVSGTGIPGAAARREFAERVAREAGGVLRDGFLRGGFRVEHKGRIDLVSEMDRASEAVILRKLAEAFPGDAVLAEESGGVKSADSLWMIDPLDGTTNYVHRHPQWCVSVGWAWKGQPAAGAIYDPLRDEMFSAEAGGGATLNGAAIHVSDVATLEDALVATGFPYDRRERADFYMAFYKAAVVTAQAVRRAGAAALDLAWTACGRADGFFELDLKEFDVCAGALLVLEAGGKVSRYDGSANTLGGREIVATNGHLHDETLALLKNAATAGR